MSNDDETSNDDEVSFPAPPLQLSPELVLVYQALQDKWTQFNLTSVIEQMCHAEAILTAPASHGLTELLRNIGLHRVSARDAMEAAVTGALGRLRTPDLLPELWAWYQAERALDVARTARTPLLEYVQVR